MTRPHPHTHPHPHAHTPSHAPASRVARVLQFAQPARRGVSTVILAAALAASGGLLLVISTTAGSGSGGSATAPSAGSKFSRNPFATSPRPLTRLSTVRDLGECGLNPQSLAAAGVTADKIEALVSAAQTHLSTAAEARNTARASVRSLRAQVARLETLAQSGKATQDDLDLLAASQSSLTTASSTLATANAALVSAACAGLSNGQIAALNHIRANRGWELPIQYLAADRSEAEWVALRDALAEKRIATADGAEVSQASTDLLATADGDTAVSDALTALTNNHADVNAAWNQAGGG